MQAHHDDGAEPRQPPCNPADELRRRQSQVQGRSRRGQALPLTRLEYALLRQLLAGPGRIHSREALFSAVWGRNSEAIDRTVDTHIKTLRAKLRAIRPDVDPIRTHRGLGYAIDIGA